MPAFFCKQSTFFGKIVLLLKAIVWKLYKKFFSSTFSFCKTIGYCWWKCKFTDHASGIRLPDSSKLAINLKNDNDIAICRHDVNIKISWRCFVSLVNFSYLSNFHANIVTGSGVMTIYFYKGLTRNPKIRNTPVWILPNNWRLRQVRNTKFGTDVSNEILLNAAKCQGYTFYRFWVIKGKPTKVHVSYGS